MKRYLKIDKDPKQLLALAGLLAMTGVPSVAMVGCDDTPDSAEDIGESIDDAADNAGDAIDDAADGIDDAVDEAVDG